MEANKKGFKGVCLYAAIYESQELSAVQKLLLAEIDALATEIDARYATSAHFSDGDYGIIDVICNDWFVALDDIGAAKASVFSVSNERIVKKRGNLSAQKAVVRSLNHLKNWLVAALT